MLGVDVDVFFKKPLDEERFCCCEGDGDLLLSLFEELGDFFGKISGIEL